MIHYEPSHSDDTQPTETLNRPTLPHRRRFSKIPQWVLLGLIVFSASSLVLTVLFTMRLARFASTSTIKRITLVTGGETRTVDSQAETVADFLAENNIQITSGSSISPSPNTTLVNEMTITIDRERFVQIQHNDEEFTFTTPYSNPYDILLSQNLLPTENDGVWVDGTRAQLEDLVTWPVAVNSIIIRQAKTITIVDEGAEITVETVSETVGDALFEAGITLYLTDAVTPQLSTTLSGDTRIVIRRAALVTINVDGTSLTTRLLGGTVADALTEAGIALVGLDYTYPDESTTVTPHMMIDVIRVTEAILNHDEEIPYQTIMQADPEMDLDQRRLMQAGVPGIRQISERVFYENGIEVGREPAGSTITREAVSEIVAYGTRIVIRSIQTPSGAIEYWRKLRVYATSYHPEALGGDDITAIGETLRHGIIGANPRIIPYRTMIYVEGYGVGMVADTGGARSSPYWIDLGYSDDDFVGWHRYVDIYLLTPVPANINYLLPEWRPMRGLPDN